MPENMKRKITVEPVSTKSKDAQSQRRPSVFERLGTKASTSSSSNPVASNNENTCRHWAQSGNCPYGKTCKYANTHTLISPSKQRAAKKDIETKQKTSHPSANSKPNNSAKDDVNKRLHSTVVVKKTHTGASPELNWENWDQTDLEYEDEKVLEKRRQLLQRELELQMKREKDEQTKKKKVKKVKKGVSSSSSTSATSSSSTESSSSSDDSSSTSSSTSADSRKKKGKPKASKRDSSSSTSGTDQLAKKKANKNVKSSSIPPAIKKVPARKDDQPSSKSKETPASKKPPPSSSKQVQSAGKKRSATPPGRSRHKSQSPSNKDKVAGSSRSSVTAKKVPGRHNSPPLSKRAQSVDRREKRNHSTSPRTSGRDRDRERDKEKERDREREKDKERDKERERDKDQGRSRSPKGKGRDRVSSPRRDSRPLRDPRKKGSPDSGNSKDKGGRVSPSKSRPTGSGARPRDTSLDSKHISAKNSPSNARDGDRRESNRNELRGDMRDRGAEAKKGGGDNRRGDPTDKGSRAKETTGDRGSHRPARDETSNRRDGDSAPSRESGRKRDSQVLLGSTGKSGQDRDFLAKNDKDRNRDPRDNSRDARDNRDNLDPRLSRGNKSLREMKEAEREKEREEALERCRERQRERERKAREEKAREHERELPSLLLITTHNPIKPVRSTGREGSKGHDKLSEKGSDRSRERDRERGSERERGLDRAVDRDRTSDRDRGLNRGLDRGPDRERGLDRSLDRGLVERERGAERDRGPERGLDRDRGPDRVSDRERGFDRDRGLDRGPERDRGLDRSMDRDRGLDRGPERERMLDRSLPERERGLERDADRDRGLDRGPPERERMFERGPDRDRGTERTPIKGLPHERSLDRVHDRGLNRGPPERNFDRGADRSFDREPDRSVFERENLDDRGYSLPPRGRDDGRRPLVGDDKGYDSPYDSRRGRDERGRYGDQLERNRYEDPAPPRDDSRRLGPDTRNFPDDRRGRGREGRGSLEPLPWEGRPRGDRVERERELHEREPDRRRQPYEREEPRSPVTSLKGRDWETRDYSDSRREWDGRGVRRGPPPDWDTLHRGEWIDKEGPPLEADWDLYGPGGQGDWPLGRERWGDEWDRPVRTPSRLPPRLVPQPPEYHHPEELPHPVIETKELPAEANPSPDKVALKDEEILKKPSDSLDGPISGKRPRESDGETEKPEPKKFCAEEIVPLEPEDLSDISDDDADEILNREDIELATTVPVPEQHNHQSPSLALQPSTTTDSIKKDGEKEKDLDAVEGLSVSLSAEINRDSTDQHSLLQQDEETLDQLDFEEISDEELEEEARAGLGDALGVDWASLVAESRPRIRSEEQPGSARRRWEGPRMLARLGISVTYAGQDLVDEVSAQIKAIEHENKENEEADEPAFLHPVALIHVSFREKLARRKALFASAGPYKRALSARRDLLVRRQLCHLPSDEANVESQGQNTEEMYRLALQLLRKAC